MILTNNIKQWHVKIANVCLKRVLCNLITVIRSKKKKANWKFEILMSNECTRKKPPSQTVDVMSSTTLAKWLTSQLHILENASKLRPLPTNMTPSPQVKKFSFHPVEHLNDGVWPPLVHILNRNLYFKKKRWYESILLSLHSSDVRVSTVHWSRMLHAPPRARSLNQHVPHHEFLYDNI